MENTPNWYTDPTGAHELRYWDGSVWTAHVSDAGVVAVESPFSAPPTPTTEQAAPTPQASPVSPAVAPSSEAPARKRLLRRPLLWILVVVAVVIVSVVAANSGSDKKTFQISGPVAIAITSGSFFNPDLADLGTGLENGGATVCSADVALSQFRGADAGWPAVVKVPFERVIKDLQDEADACLNNDLEAFNRINTKAAADLVAAGKAWDSHCTITDVFADPVTATCSG